jgi:hypothetical protein
MSLLRPVFFPQKQNKLNWLLIITVLRIYVHIDKCQIHDGITYGCRSQWARGLKHEPSSLARTLESWVQIPLKAHAGSTLADFSTLKMEAIRSSETSVNPRSTQRYIPEDNILHSHRCESLRSYIDEYRWLKWWIDDWNDDEYWLLFFSQSAVILAYKPDKHREGDYKMERVCNACDVWTMSDGLHLPVR